MFSGCQQREEYEDELYHEEDEDDSSLSEPDSELECHLYSQLHYCTEVQENQEVRGDEKPNEEALQPGQESPPTPTAPVEVIVIDSGPDAITISDNTEDEDSVCALKGQRSRGRSKVNRKALPSASLPPRHFRSEKARNVMEEVVVVVVEDSESEGSSDSCSVAPFVEDLDSDSDSDSDGLESWMILGQGKEEGDQGIQLNLSSEGGGMVSVFDENSSDGGDRQHWAVSDRDKEAQIFNKGLTTRRLSNRYYTKKTVTCRNCDKVGHLSKNCPNPKKLSCCSLCGLQGHEVRSCPNRPCPNCFVPGHSYDACLDRPYWHKHCYRCGMTGHFANACPEIWRQYHLTTAVGLPVRAPHPTACRTPAYCYNCSTKGHFGHECSERRMFNGTYPTLPLICSYDTLRGIRRLEHWAQKRANELQEAGLLESSEALLTAQPLRKKQRPNPKNTFSPHTAAAHGPKRRIAHTPKHHPQTTPRANPPTPRANTPTPRANTPTWCQQGGRTPAHKATPPLQSAFTPRRQGKKKKRKNPIVLDSEDFPRTFRKSGADGGAPAVGGARSPGMLFGPGKNSERSMKKKNRAQKRARKAAGGGAPDENLFAIKQRKRSR